MLVRWLFSARKGGLFKRHDWGKCGENVMVFKIEIKLHIQLIYLEKGLIGRGSSTPNLVDWCIVVAYTDNICNFRIFLGVACEVGYRTTGGTFHKPGVF